MRLMVTVVIDGEKKHVKFTRSLREENLKALAVSDIQLQNALESTSAFGSEYWLHQEVSDVKQVVKAPVATQGYSKPKEVTEDIPESKPLVTDYPEVTTGQKAKLTLLKLIPGSTHAQFTNSTKIRETAKAHNISFSNWQIQ